MDLPAGGRDAGFLRCAEARSCGGIVRCGRKDTHYYIK